MEKGKVCCIVGHQPANLPFGCSEKDIRCVRLKESLETEIRKMIQNGTYHFMCPMNLGAELYAAEIIEQVQKDNPSVTITAVLPYETQAEDWAEPGRDRFFETVQHSTEEVFTSRRYDDTCIAKNLEYMLGFSDELVAVWNGSPGNVEYAVREANRRGIPVIQINPELV